jgi:pSer/pThr/pTyr-binding forkhead associated (FHA) protein
MKAGREEDATFMKQQPVIIVQLVHIQGPFKGKIQEFCEDRISIGRHPSSVLRFPADLTVVSRNHAEIIREGNRFKLIDHSSNGTFVDGKRVQDAYLKNGAVLSFAEGGPKVSFLTQIRENQAGKESESLALQPAEQTPSAPNSLYDDSRLSFDQAHAPLHQEAVSQVHQESVSQGHQDPVSQRTFNQEPVNNTSSNTSSGQKSSIQESVSQALFSQKPDPVRSEPDAAGEIMVQSMRVPLIIQYGPSLHSFKEVPIIIGKAGKFQLDHPCLHNQHAQIFYNQGSYWVKDLTGQKLIRINQQPINLQSPLNPGDELALSPQGPLFRFLGGGRLAEIQEAADEHSISSPRQGGGETQEDATVKKESKGPLSILKKLWKR